MSIIFKKSNGEQVFTLRNFTIKGINHPVVRYEFYFVNDDFEGNLDLEAELFDLEDLLKGLIFMNNNLKGGFYFEPMISGRIKIKMEMSDSGQINIDGFVSNQSYSTKLSFNFQSDQTFLKDLISQYNLTINFLKMIN
jgi:hypothetical protein